MTAHELVVSVLAEHGETGVLRHYPASKSGGEPTGPDWWTFCKCGERSNEIPSPKMHRAHVASKVIDRLGIERIGYTKHYHAIWPDQNSPDEVPVYRLKALEEGET